MIDSIRGDVTPPSRIEMPVYHLFYMYFWQ